MNPLASDVKHYIKSSIPLFGSVHLARGIMRVVCLCLVLLVLFLGEGYATKDDRVYIVYMGASDSAKRDHAQLLSSLMKRKRDSVVQTYSNGFAGFAARLSDEEAESMAQRPGVVSVFPDPVLQLHTTRSWEFLKFQTAVKIDSAPISSSDSIIGILDTGIWPESPSFVDDDMGPIPSRWKGKCMEGKNFTSSTCNKKLIGARYYDDPFTKDTPFGTPRDESGHGTHVASTAAGRPVSGASYYNLAKGTAEGGSPGSRIAMYRVCIPTGGCLGSAILKGFDDAIADGVDVLSLSLGSSPGMPNFATDPIAIGAFHAVAKGITVVCSAGNSGPVPVSVVNVAPWIITVGATTIDRDFETDILLGTKKVIKGGGINFSTLNKSSIYPLIDGESAKDTSKTDDDNDARLCQLGSLDDSKVKGKIVLCDNADGGANDARDKFDYLRSQEAIGMILIDNNMRQVAEIYGNFPAAAVTGKDGAQILSYIKSESKPVATILPTVSIQNYKPAPAVPYFSSRGPTPGIRNLLKPDVAAPGVAILAAWPANVNSEALPGKEPPPIFYILSGTSMACPHVSGLAAAVKSQHPTWGPSAIRSAIMTTAIQTNNQQGPITTNSGSTASPYDIGAGEISVTGPLEPGLVYEIEWIGYLDFLCNMGYDITMIKNIAPSLPSNYSCPANLSPDGISNMNYPSIGVSGLKEGESKTVSRTVTNVGEGDSVYTATVEAPEGLKVEVVPSKLQFITLVKKLSFQVTFKLSAYPKEDLFGSITWSNDKFKVRSPFVVSKN